MNAFLEHHQQAIRFEYSCFDRILLNGVIQVLQNPACVVGFLKQNRQADPRDPRLLPGHLHRLPPLRPGPRREASRRDPHAPQGRPPRGVGRAVLPTVRANPASPSSSRPARTPASPSASPARAITSSCSTASSGSTTSISRTRTSAGCSCASAPYFPFNARVCLNGHEWLACRLREEGIAFEQCANAFRTCADPARLQQLADRFSAADIEACGHRWLRPVGALLHRPGRRHQGFGYRLFVSQVEYCTNLVFSAARRSTACTNACWTSTARSVSRTRSHDLRPADHHSTPTRA